MPLAQKPEVAFLELTGGNFLSLAYIQTAVSRQAATFDTISGQLPRTMATPSKEEQVKALLEAVTGCLKEIDADTLYWARGIFASMDADSSGSVSRDELWAFLR